jgi:hypothetical protein
MPKQYHKINRFDGGLNTKDDPRDIAENQFSDSLNIAVDTLGRMRSQGGASEVANNGSNTDIEHGGYGLFIFSSDYDSGSNNDYDDDGNAATNQSSQHTMLIDADNSQIDLEDGDGNWTQGKIDLGNGGSARPVFYVAEGAVRIADSNLTALGTNAPYWFSYIEREHFDGSLDKAYDGWYAKSVALLKPTLGLFSLYFKNMSVNAGSSNATTLVASNNAFLAAETGGTSSVRIEDHIAVGATSNVAGVISNKASGNSTTVTTASIAESVWDDEDDEVWICPGAGTGFNLHASVTASSDYSWEAGDYMFGQSFVYEGNQESHVAFMSTPASGSSTRNNAAAVLTVTSGDLVNATVIATSPYDPRIIGGRIYVRENKSDDPWTLLVDINLRRGGRSGLDSDYTAWTKISTVSSSIHQYVDVFSPGMNMDTYETLNGYPPDIPSVSLADSIGAAGTARGYRDATVANNRAFVCAPVAVNEDSELKFMGDRIMYTPPNKYDTFPTPYHIEVGINDGEEFTALESFADRLLAFKQQKLYIINIAQGNDTNWFLEASYDNRGVALPGAIAKTPNGVVWVNKHGCYMYDGSNVIDLTANLDDGSDVIGDTTWGWSEFIEDNLANGPSIVGYYPKKDQIIVVSRTEGTSGASAGAVAGNYYLYDFRTKSWVKGAGSTGSANAIFGLDSGAFMTNFVNDKDGNLLFAKHVSGSYTGKIRKWTDLPTNQKTHLLVTKDIDFGEPSKLKKIYKVYVTYKASAALQDTGTDDIPFLYAKDGSNTFANFDNCSGSTSALASTSYTNSGATNWDIAVLSDDSAFTCQSLKIKLDVATADQMLEINDITIEYRIIHKAVS